MTGTMNVSQTTKGGFTVDLECTQRTIEAAPGSAVTHGSTYATPAGTRAAIVLKRGSPVQAIFVWQMNDPYGGQLPGVLRRDHRDQGREIIRYALEPIEGTVELARSKTRGPIRRRGLRPGFHPTNDRSAGSVSDSRESVPGQPAPPGDEDRFSPGGW